VLNSGRHRSFDRSTRVGCGDSSRRLHGDSRCGTRTGQRLIAGGNDNGKKDCGCNDRDKSKAAQAGRGVIHRPTMLLGARGTRY